MRDEAEEMLGLSKPPPNPKDVPPAAKPDG
jgi:hypothetical protein